MNRYGLMAQKHWVRWLPARYAQIEDPGSFFSELGDADSGTDRPPGAATGRRRPARRRLPGQGGPPGPGTAPGGGDRARRT